MEESTLTLKEDNNVISANCKKEMMVKEKLPEYIYPIIEDSKIKGYYVEGIVNSNGEFYERRNFNENTNRWNLANSNELVSMLQYINDNDVDISDFEIEDLDVNDVDKSFYEKYYLPKYFNLLRKRGVIEGFCINGFPDNRYKDGKYKKKFPLKDKTLDEVYKEGLAFLKNLKLEQS
jgi:hypothetical protein